MTSSPSYRPVSLRLARRRPSLISSLFSSLYPGLFSSRVFRRYTTVALGLAAAVLIAGCSEEVPTDFTADNESGFMAACSAQLEDSELISSICQCVFERTEVDIPFSEFAQVDRQLRENPDRVLSAEIQGIIADCVISEAEL